VTRERWLKPQHRHRSCADPDDLERSGLHRDGAGAMAMSAARAVRAARAAAGSDGGRVEREGRGLHGHDRRQRDGGLLCQRRGWLRDANLHAHRHTEGELRKPRG
jgi:hypothetical protein